MDKSALSELISSCLVPELRHEIGHDSLDSSQFRQFRKSLDQQLPLVFDLIQQNEDSFSATETDTLQMRTDLILLTCEQSALGTVFQTENPNLQMNIHALREKWFVGIVTDSKVRERIFEYYQRSLGKDNWKRNIGAANGFVQYLESLEMLANYAMDMKMTNFALSVGLNFIEFFEPVFKEMGIGVFERILKYTPTAAIKDINIHSVIYTSAFKIIHKIDSREGTIRLWNCICHCLDYTDEVELFQWNRRDDLIEVLLSKSSMASSPSICQLYFWYIAKLCVGDSLNRKSVEEMLQRNRDVPFDEEDFIVARKHCSEITSYTSFRWAKSILDMLISLSYHIMGAADRVYPLINTMHILYLVCIYPIPILVLEPHMDTFLKKFVAVLMEVLRKNKADLKVKKIIKEMLTTLSLQLLVSGDCEKMPILKSYEDALEKVLQVDILCT